MDCCGTPMACVKPTPLPEACKYNTVWLTDPSINWEEKCKEWTAQYGCESLWTAFCPGVTPAPDGTDGSATTLAMGCPVACFQSFVNVTVSDPGTVSECVDDPQGILRHDTYMNPAGMTCDSKM